MGWDDKLNSCHSNGAESKASVVTCAFVFKSLRASVLLSLSTRAYSHPAITFGEQGSLAYVVVVGGRSGFPYLTLSFTHIRING